MVTQKDIAQEAGLSVGTVSDILNRRQGVQYGEDTVQRVREVSEKLGYRRDRLASALRRGKSFTVGVAVPDLADPYTAALLKRFMMRLRAEGFEIVVAELEPQAGDEEWAKTIQDLAAMRIDGLFIFQPDSENESLGKALALSPIAVITHGFVLDNADAVTIDFEPAIRKLAERMAALGHRRVLLVDDSPRPDEPGPRLRLVREQLYRAGLQGDDILLLPTPPGPEAAHDAMEHYLDTTAPEQWPTAIVAANDFLAIGVMRACTEQRLAIPGDISFVAFDNTTLGGLLQCGLTSIGVNINQVADRISNRLVSRLRASKALSKPLRLSFEADLVLRESLGTTAQPEK